MVNNLNERTVRNMRPDNIHTKDNINLHQILGWHTTKLQQSAEV